MSRTIPMDRRREVADAIRAGGSVRAVAEQTGVSEQTVRKLRADLAAHGEPQPAGKRGAKPGKPVPCRRKAHCGVIAEMMAAGRPHKVIRARVGLSTGAYTRAVQRMRARGELPPPPPTPRAIKPVPKPAPPRPRPAPPRPRVVLPPVCLRCGDLYCEPGRAWCEDCEELAKRVAARVYGSLREVA